jgi:hypothetical protein
MRHISRFELLAFSLAGILAPAALAACGEGSPNPKPPQDSSSSASADKNNETSTSATKPAPSSSSPAPSTSAAPAPTGTTATTADDCYAQCDAKNPAASAAYAPLWTKRNACMCQPATCATACAKNDACQADGPEPTESDACGQCEANAGAKCDDDLATACKADPTCAPIATCYDACDGTTQ